MILLTKYLDSCYCVDVDQIEAYKCFLILYDTLCDVSLMFPNISFEVRDFVGNWFPNSPSLSAFMIFSLLENISIVWISLKYIFAKLSPSFSSAGLS